MRRIIFLLIAVINSQWSLAQSPQLFLPDEVSTNLNERDMAISPDGSEMFYTMQGNQNSFSVIIHRTKTSGNKWSAPEVASFSGRFGDLEPAFSTDGKKLFFSSNRPVAGTALKDYDIWVTEKNRAGWSEPKNLGKLINTEFNEFYPSVTSNGNLYFTAEYKKGIGKEDIFVSRMVDGSYTESVALDTAVNSRLYEFNAFVSPDEQFILFTGYGRKDDAGGGDLYISIKDSNGNWQTAKNLSFLNSKKLDYCPVVSFDKKVMYFTSSRHAILPYNEKPLVYADLIEKFTSPLNGSENIYWVNFGDVLKAIQEK
jgi:Tol biopolymer transport system component